MGTIPYAFSVQHFVSTVGADAGFAAIIGLAVLILLYFSQARETASLRDWAAESAEHVRELEVRVAQLTRAHLPSSPAPPPPGIPRSIGVPAAVPARAGVGSPVVSRTVSPAAVAVASAAPAAPAGVGAPALSAATRLIPSTDRERISIRAGSATGTVSEARPGFVDGDTAMLAAGPPPATAAGGANGSAAAPAPAPAPPGLPLSQAPARGGGRRGELPSGTRAVAGSPRRPAVPSGRSGVASRSPISRVFIALLGLLALAAVVVIVLVATSGSSSPSSARSNSAAATTQAKTKSGSRTRSTRAGATPIASAVTVAVLNGTSTANLAHAVSTRLGSAGFKPGMTGNASDQTQTATVVGYLPHEQRAALIVAKALKLGSASVQPVDTSSQAVACPASSTPCAVQVVVTVGSDLASNP